MFPDIGLKLFSESKRDNSHGFAVTVLKQHNDMKTAKAKAISKSKDAIIGAMKNVVFAGKYNLANIIVPELNALCISQGALHLNDLKVDGHTNYEHHSSIKEFQQSIAEVIVDDLVKEVSDSGVFSIMYLATLSGRVEPVTRFLGIKQLSSADAELALGAGSAADKVRYLVKFQDILNSIYKYFANSPKNMSRLETLQKVLEESESCTRFKQVFHTRWLSFEGSVQAVVDNYSSLVSVFLEDNSAKALAMHKPISTYKFLYVAHFLADVLKQLAILCKSFQSSDINFTAVHPLLHSTVGVLEDMATSGSGSYICEFLSKVPSQPCQDETGLCTFEYKGHTIRDSQQQRSEAVSVCHQFVKNVVSNLRDRFTDEGDARVLNSMTQLFDPLTYIHSVDGDVFTDIISRLSGYLSVCSKCKESEVSDNLRSFVSYAKTVLDQNGKVYGSVSDMVQLAIRCKSTYPSVAMAAERLLVSPVSTVDCERGFSRVNIIKTDLRNKLAEETLNNLVRISIDCNDNFCYDDAFKKWAAVKERHILM
ncbi:hypothetical protein KUTeg_015610 [Tegillarca granosa]|uniref:HAT C-terminal dimerisation domain-containing protein n=1 Tax=Tegillarca granosa TaxID=220873 RepID=A0ABQ9EU96_TEGGR|nr:hypothetical protein KUTeg_015610 [Tegillarca granosa]